MVQNDRFLRLMEQKTVIFDGAMGTSIQALPLTVEDFGGPATQGCNDYLVITAPSAVESIHASFLEAGADVLETCTFRANRLTLADYGLQDRTYEINYAAAQLARRVADEFTRKTGTERLVAGSIGPSGKLPSMSDPELSNIRFPELADLFREQAKGLIEGGCDLLIIETSQDILEVKAAIDGIRQAWSETGITIPIQAQVTMDITGRMLLGTDISAVNAILDGFPIAVMGLNCSTGPDYMREPIRFLSENARYPVSCIPNAGLPLNIDGKAVYPMKAAEFGEIMADFVRNMGAQVVGGCCGTTPEHIRLLSQMLGAMPAPKPKGRKIAQLASAAHATSIRQEPPPFLIGERLNTQGSARFKQMVLSDDYESALGIARNQIDNGAHGLDLCTALTERADEPETMYQVIKTIAPSSPVPLIIDSTEADVVERALQTAPGKCLINSTNLESGPAKPERIFGLAKRYNAAVMGLTIDESGMAKTAERKLEVAGRLIGIANTQFGIPHQDIVIDCLTFTLATGEEEYLNSAVETIEGIRRIKEIYPEVHTSLGVSNVSFGLSAPARALVNSIMLHHCVAAGLDMAIVNPAHITPYPEINAQEKELAEDLVLNRRADALQRLIAFFEGKDTRQVSKADTKSAELSAMQPAERLGWKIIHRLKDGVEDDIDLLITGVDSAQRHVSAVRVLNDVLLPAMKEVGDRFGAGELILPFVLQSAEVMKKSVSHLENYLEQVEGTSKGTLVLATVYGDVHDIGKNLVKTILSNNGYTVVDLGKQVPAETIISRAVEEKADAIGLSALLVATSRQMPLIINEMDRRGLKIPVMVGGAAINRRFGRRILKTDQGAYYPGGVFYCKDAFEGLAVMDQVMDSDGYAKLIAQGREEAAREEELAKTQQPRPTDGKERSDVPPASSIPQPPFWGPRTVEEMPLEQVLEHLPLNELFRLSWGAKNTHGEEWKKVEKDFQERLRRMRMDASQNGWLRPRAVYGYWPAQAEGNTMLIYDPVAWSRGEKVVLERMVFPRQPDGDLLCLADYFQSVESGVMDTVIFQVVTVGEIAAQRFARLQEQGEFTEAYFTHGLSVQSAEATADFLHNFIRCELGLEHEQGKRYSWGYPAIPDLDDHQTVFRLLPAREMLGMDLTSAGQLMPEQSTAAIIIHHPAARYFSVGENRIDQLTRKND